MLRAPWSPWMGAHRLPEFSIYPDAPIKRMSILERRPQDDRAFFSRHWRDVHGGMVSRLPHLYAYIQNHILEDIPHGHPVFPGDGLVEQLWRSTRQMQQGYNSPVVDELVSDEVNYLGHGSNYAILAAGPLREASNGSKLVVALRHGGDTELADAISDAAETLCPDIARDDVIATIAKPNFLPTQPHPVDMFLHIYCRDPAEAVRTGSDLAKKVSSLPFREKAALSVWRVATATIISPDHGSQPG